MLVRTFQTQDLTIDWKINTGLEGWMFSETDHYFTSRTLIGFIIQNDKKMKYKTAIGTKTR